MIITINDITYNNLLATMLEGTGILTLHIADAAATLSEHAPLNSAPKIIITDGGKTSFYAGRKVLELHTLSDGSARIVMQADPIEETEADKLRAEIESLKAQLAQSQAAQDEHIGELDNRVTSTDEQIDMMLSGDTEEAQHEV